VGKRSVIGQKIVNISENRYKFMKNNKTNVKKLIKQADKCLELARWEEAEKILRQVIKFNQKNPEAYYLLGEALCKQERFIESINLLSKADKLLPNNPRILHLLGWTHFMNDNPNIGRELMKKAHHLFPEDIQILCDLAVLENKEGNENQALLFINKALEIDPVNEMAKEVYQAILYFRELRSKLTNKIN
jgi:Flp pilus assembly protein TadD